MTSTKSWLGIAPRENVEGAAVFSANRRYRYTLERIWSDPRDGHVLFVGLNPSTADAQADDPTIRRMAQFAYHWGFAGMTVCNLFAFRATDPRELKTAGDPVGSENNRVLQREARRAAFIVACWGNYGAWHQQTGKALGRLSGRSRPLFCLGLTRLGQPKHPLYLRRDVTPIPMNAGLFVCRHAAGSRRKPLAAASS